MKAVAALLALIAAPAVAECRDDTVSVVGEFGRAAFRVAVADDPQERAQGLMFVEEMGRFEGMLFVYETPQHATFWMRNTLIPLDMLFADETGTVTHIHENAVPLDESTIDGGRGVRFVLEINGGMAEMLGMDTGATLQHPAIGAAAALPCS